MLQEFSSGRADAPPAGRAAAARASTTSCGSFPWPIRTPGLANQLLLLDRLTQALVRRRRHGGEVVVCHIDLDNLGEINLDLGYTTGNTVLCEVSRRLTSVLRAEDTVGRVGGSELVVVVTVNDEQAVGPADAPLAAHARRAGHGGRTGHPAARLLSGSPLPRTPSPPRTSCTRADRSTRVSRR